MYMESEKKSMLCVIAISYIVFMTGWYLRETYIDFSSLNPHLEACVNFVIYGMWWCGFAFFMIHCFGKRLSWNLSKIFTTRPHGKALLIAIPLVLFYYLICWAVAGFEFSFEMNLLDYLLTVLGVGIFEESVFRGWFYNAWSTIVKEKYANIISTAMFVFVHYPRWFQLERAVGDIVYGSVYVLVLGILFGVMFRKNHSLWTSAIVHSVWDALGFLI